MKKSNSGTNQRNRGKTGSKRKGICAYCGKHDFITADHIPPKSIFALPRPGKMITVPACDDCHGPLSKDDEYFRERMCLKDDAHGHPDVNGNIPTIFRALAYPEAKWMKQKLVNDTHEVDVVTPGGIFIGKRMAFDVDMHRICSVVARIVRGLYFVENRVPLPADKDVLVLSEEMLSNTPPDELAEYTRTIIRPLAERTPKVIGKETFSYRHAAVEPASVWGLVFFNAIRFLAITAPKRD